MTITTDEVRLVQEIYLKNFGLKIDKDEARLQLQLLCGQLASTYKPITQKQYDDFTEQELNEDEDVTDEQGRAARDS